MDIDKLQKVNALAREYVKHGMAKSMDEAVRMAEDKFKDAFGERLPQAHSDKGPVQPVKPTAAPQQNASSQHGSAQQAPVMEADVLEELTNIVKAQATQIERISSKMNEMIGEINSIKEKMDKLGKPTFAPQSSQPEVQTQFKPQPPASDKPSSHARTGTYKPGDVSVEKFFYSGSGNPKR